MAEHTPGPWKIQYGGMPNDEGFGIASDNAANGFCMVAERWPCTSTDADRNRMFADAHLICAAPDLLRELVHLVSLLEPLEQDGGLEVPGLATLNGARAAIAKACN